jgi:hypothetical protein
LEEDFKQRLVELDKRQNDLEHEVHNLRSQLRQLHRQSGTWMVDRDQGAGLALFLCGCFCALWAQNTRRNPWLWFFLGLFFSIFTLLVLLAKNAEDSRRLRSPSNSSL